MISKMLERLKKLLNSFAVQRSLAVNFIEQQEIVHLVELRVVREFNLPDNYVNILRVIYFDISIIHGISANRRLAFKLCMLQRTIAGFNQTFERSIPK